MVDGQPISLAALDLQPFAIEIDLLHPCGIDYLNQRILENRMIQVVLHQIPAARTTLNALGLSRPHTLTSRPWCRASVCFSRTMPAQYDGSIGMNVDGALLEPVDLLSEIANLIVQNI